MRALLALVGIAAVVVAIMVSLGLLTFKANPGALPQVSVNGGTAPSVDANVATLSVGVTNKTIEVPTVGTTEKTISVPTVKMTRPGEPTGNSAQ